MLLSVHLRILSRVVLKRLRNATNKQLQDEQAVVNLMTTSTIYGKRAKEKQSDKYLDGLATRHDRDKNTDSNQNWLSYEMAYYDHPCLPTWNMMMINTYKSHVTGFLQLTLMLTYTSNASLSYLPHL